MTERSIRLDRRLDNPAPDSPGPWFHVQGINGTDVYVHFTQVEDGRNVVNGLMMLGDRVSPEQLRDVPLAQVEHLANAPADVDAEEFIQGLQPLQRRNGEPPEEFAKRVAWYYRIFAATSRSPAKAIAEKSNVPVKTVHWWIQEARRLGALPPGRHGKVG